LKRDFADIRRKCHGMMRSEVYHAIYNHARKAPGDQFVELGTAHGAATVCLAAALFDTGRINGCVHTFDRFYGYSRRGFLRNAAGNIEFVRKILNVFGMSELVEIYRVDLANMPSEIYESIKDIGLLMLDVDGRIDRDLGRFYDSMLPEAAVVVDDVADRVRVKIGADGAVKVDQKHKLTRLLISSAERAGLVKCTNLVNQTWFGNKANGARFRDWSSESKLRQYRELVFASARMG
jgi:hypothetical protein